MLWEALSREESDVLGFGSATTSLWAQGKNRAVGREGGEEVVWHRGAGECVWDSVCFTVSQEIFFVTPVVHVFTDYYF